MGIPGLPAREHLPVLALRPAPHPPQLTRHPVSPTRPKAAGPASAPFFSFVETRWPLLCPRSPPYLTVQQSLKWQVLEIRACIRRYSFNPLLLNLKITVWSQGQLCLPPPRQRRLTSLPREESGTREGFTCTSSLELRDDDDDDYYDIIITPM